MSKDYPCNDYLKNAFMLVLILGCVTVNFVTLDLKHDGESMYLMQKQVEFFTHAKSVEAIDAISEAKIRTRTDFYRYLTVDFARNMFWNEAYFDKRKDLSAEEKTIFGPLLQRELLVVGKIVIQVVHQNIQKCLGPQVQQLCYPLDQLLEQNVYKKPIGDQEWGKFKKASEMGFSERSITGDLSNYSNDGYYLTFDVQDTTQEQFIQSIEDARGVLFGVGARMVRLEFTVLSESRELFVYSDNVFEYGVSNQVIQSQSQFKPFLLKNEQ